MRSLPDKPFRHSRVFGGHRAARSGRCGEFRRSRGEGVFLLAAINGHGEVHVVATAMIDDTVLLLRLSCSVLSTVRRHPNHCALAN